MNVADVGAAPPIAGTVRDSSGRVIHSDRWTSHYIRVDGVLQVGVG